MKDLLQWKLSLRNDEYFNVANLGIKNINLARNALG